MPTENPRVSLAMNEAGSLTELVIQIHSAKPPAEARAELARGLGALRFDNLRVYCQSLERDPAENSTCYLAVDVVDSGKISPVLFQWSPAAAETRPMTPNDNASARRVSLVMFRFEVGPARRIQAAAGIRVNACCTRFCPRQRRTPPGRQPATRDGL